MQRGIRQLGGVASAIKYQNYRNGHIRIDWIAKLPETTLIALGVRKCFGSKVLCDATGCPQCCDRSSGDTD